MEMLLLVEELTCLALEDEVHEVGALISARPIFFSSMFSSSYRVCVMCGCVYVYNEFPYVHKCLCSCTLCVMLSTDPLSCRSFCKHTGIFADRQTDADKDSGTNANALPPSVRGK